MAKSSTQQALALPEILSIILKEFASATVSNIRTLEACARVSRAFNYEAVQILWKNPPSTVLLRTLSEVADKPERFNLYLRHVKHLNLNRVIVDSNAKLWDQRLWQSAQYLSLTVNTRGSALGQQCIEAILYKKLRSLEVLDGCNSNNLLRSISSRCPDVRWLTLGGNSDFTSQEIFQMFQSAKYLQGFELASGSEEVVDESVLLAMANLPYLKHLKLEIIDSFTEQVLLASNHKFETLRSLRLETSNGRGLPCLLPHLVNLESFELAIWENEDPSLSANLEHHVLLPISHCHRLLSIVLWFEGEDDVVPAVSTDTLSRFAMGCHKLVAFHVYGWRGDNMVIQDWAGKLHCLEELRFRQYDQETVNPADWMTISLACPSLRALYFDGDIRLHDLDYLPYGVVLPQLQYMKARSFTIKQHTQQQLDTALNRDSIFELIKESLLRIMPRLANLQEGSHWGGEYPESLDECYVTDEFMREINKRLGGTDHDRASLHESLKQALMGEAISGH